MYNDGTVIPAMARKITHFSDTTHMARDAITKTILYSDIFSFPLTKDEIWKYLKTTKKISKYTFDHTICSSLPMIEEWNGYFFLSGRKNIVGLRKKREKISRGKFQLAHQAASVLAYIPSVLFVGISGSLASKNAKKQDDVDLFIITSSHTLWISRLFILLLLSILGVRRKKGGVRTENTVCVNMLLSEKKLLLPKERRDIYTAHEVAQLVPVVNRNNIFEHFLAVNIWVTNILPNSFDMNTLQKQKSQISKSIGGTLLNHLGVTILQLIDIYAKILQLWKINRNRTTETVTNSLLAFHPKDPRFHIIHRYETRIKEYGLSDD